MAKIGDPECKTQEQVVKLFRDAALLGYEYYGDLREQANPNVMPDRLLAWLRSRDGGGIDESIATKAIGQLVGAAGNLAQGPYKANQEVYVLLKYGAGIRENPGESPLTVRFIDWEYPHKNIFAIAEEVTIKDQNTRRPDLVVYINGIAVAVMELKKSTVSVSNGIRQNISNQSEHFNQPFFTTIQFVMAGNNSEGLRYAPIDTEEKYFLEWKNDTENTPAQPLDNVSLDILDACKQLPNKLDWQLYSLFHKKRFLDILHNFVAFDSGIKKLCRHNQFFGVKKAQLKVSKNQGGIIWHTQGSGKTLTMVWLSKWLLEKSPTRRILIVTDRDELDYQMEQVYKGVGEPVYRTDSCKDLIDVLGRTDKRLICTLIHKFGARGSSEHSERQAAKNIEQFLKELRNALPKGFEAQGDFVVFVDECHRTQSGNLHAGMKEILPNALYIGFTGTPLLVKDKKTSLEVFSPGFIHTYKYDEAVRDGVVLDLRYEARDVDQIITAPERIDEHFEAKMRGLNDTKKAKLKSKWANMQKVYSSRNRLEVIAKDIWADFDLKPRLADGHGNAMLVADSIYSACKYWEIFQIMDFKECAVITSYDPNPGNLRTEAGNSEEFEKYEAYQKMLNGQSAEDFEKEAKRKFVEEPANMKLLIVVDKLLTGFDAPPCTYLYLDSKMQDVGLFQAICRVNRLDGEKKDFGYIVDYKQLFGHLRDAVQKYTSDAFDGFDAEDIKGVIKDRLAEGRKYLDSTLEELDDLCGGVAAPRERIDYVHYFCGVDGVGGIDDEFCSRSREKLYKLVNRVIRAYSEIKGEMEEAGYSQAERQDIHKKVEFYTNLKNDIGNSSGDFMDLKAWEADMRRLIDTYIRAEDSRKIGNFDDFTLLDFVTAHGEKLDGKNKEAAAEAIENNIRRNVVERILVNPKYYEKLSAILDELIKDRRNGAVAYEQLLEKYLQLAREAESPENSSHYPESIRNSGALRAFYDNCGQNEELAIAIDRAVREKLQDRFRNDPFKERPIKKALFELLNDKDEVERIFNIVVKQGEY